MTLKKLQLKPGVNKENTRYANENGWYDSDKVRFRQGTPEKIGGWVRISANTFLGVCRSLWNWVTLANTNLVGVGTNLKFYLENQGAYYDITPIRLTTTLGTDPFLGDGTTSVKVTSPSHGAITGDYVTFSGVTGAYATLLNAEYSIIYDTANSYYITTASSVAAGSTGGSAVSAAYQINTGPAIQIPLDGWGSGSWGSGSWGFGTSSTIALQLWNQNNFGEDLIFGPRGGAIYYWDATNGVTTRGVLLSAQGGNVTFTNASPTVLTLTTVFESGTPVQFAATGSLPSGVSASTTYYLSNVSGLTANIRDSAGTLINTTSTGSGAYISNLVDVPSVQNFVFVSDASRFVFAFGCNDYGSSAQNPMLIRWSDQENPLWWTPAATNQAGSLTLSHGSQIVTMVQTRQEIVVFTDSSIYSLQYLGPPAVWSSQLLGDNVSIIGQNAAVIASGRVYWMGVDKFYVYDGRVNTLNCDLRKYIYQDINLEQSAQVFCSTNEGFNEVWWFYCSITGPNGTGTIENPNTTIDRYVIYNYIENNGQGVWYYGNMARTAWLDSGLRNYPVAATYSYNLVNHEDGVDDNETAVTLPIEAYISSSEFDIDDGDKFGFVWRMLPDVTFEGSTAANPSVTMTLIPMQNSGSGYNNPTSVGGSDNASVVRSATVPIEQFTGQVYIRVRGRQMIMKIESVDEGVQWQLGYPRIDIRQDGRR
jgi:hypothetical protein